ncbi:MAG TPA: Flp pilus assembly protein CpaB [Stellaceae bacterium]|nr:Flp pilus assembly protein CpaB [Stellaceae bacterium]
MPAKTILTVLFVISLGVVVVLYLSALSQRVNADTAGPKNEILTATRPLAPGTLLRAQDVVWQPIAGTAEPGQIPRPPVATRSAKPDLDEQARAEVYGAALRVGVAPGAPILRGVIVKPGDRDFLQIVLSPGARAIAIPVATGGASTGLLYPGDRVDVMLTQTFKRNDAPLTRRSVSETVVESLRVLAVDPSDSKPAGAGNGFGRTVTLEATREQVEKINVATELGKLSLALRSISSADGILATAAPGPGRTTGIKPTWAGDVSPALTDAMPPNTVIADEQPAVEVIHGTKAVAVKTQ